MNTHEITQKAMQLVLQGNGNKAINGQALAEYEIGQVKSRFIWMDGTETIVPAAQVEEFFNAYWPEPTKQITGQEYLKAVEVVKAFHQQVNSMINTVKPAIDKPKEWDKVKPGDILIFQKVASNAKYLTRYKPYVIVDVDMRPGSTPGVTRYFIRNDANKLSNFYALSMLRSHLIKFKVFEAE